jgi:sugar phosphate isomerase/epimerase
MVKRLSRRNLLAASAGLTTTSALAVAAPAGSMGAAKRRGVPLGLDNFAVRAMKWKASALIDYAARLRVDSLFITDLDAFESLEPRALSELRKKAADLGVRLQLGSWSICPTSTTFRQTWGTAEEHLALAIRVARDLGSPVARVVLGRVEDRSTEGGIAARIADTVKVLRSQRGRAEDAGVRVAVENHAGDLQARELVGLVEAAGGKRGPASYVGVNIDPGNAVWAMEDPVAHLELLGPYTVTSSMRDSFIWQSASGATVQWTAMGEGVVDFATYFDRFAVLCPGVPVHIETISGVNRDLPFLDPRHWETYPDMKAADLARFVALAQKGSSRSGGKGRPPWSPPPEATEAARLAAEQRFQRSELERSLAYCRDVLGLGLRAASPT